MSMSTAELVLKTIQNHSVKEWSAISYAAGYGMDLKGNRVLFAPCRVISEKRNKQGRCIYMLGEYSDGSKIIFKWSKSKGSRVTAVSPQERVIS